MVLLRKRAVSRLSKRPDAERSRGGAGLQCRAPAVRGHSVCRMHGVRGGAPEGNRNALKNGACSAEALALSRHIRALARMAHKTLDAMK